MNLFEKTIAAISPEKAVRRASARRALKVMNSGYGEYGANTRKKSLLSFKAPGGSAREDIDRQADILRRRSRELYSGGSAIATAAIKTMRTNVVGRGLRLAPRIDAETLNISREKATEIEKQIRREFNLWANTPECDITRRNNFAELQQLVFLSWLMNGDALALFRQTERPGMPYDLRIQLVEADRLSTPDKMRTDEKISEGVETNEYGEVVAYHICNKHPYEQGMKVKKEWQRVEAYGKETGRPNVLFICNDERIGQRRGVPFLAPVIADLKEVGRYTDAEVTAAVVASYLTVFIEKNETNEGSPLGEGIPVEDQIDAADETSIELGPGSVYDLGEGEHANAVTPGRPNTAFDGFINSMATQIGSALEIPTEILLKKFNASYSASRGALLEAWKNFRMYREWLAADFCQPIYEEWLAEAVSKGRISAPGFFASPAIRKAYSGAEWNGPAQGLLDPIKEATAAEKRIILGLTTHQKEAMEMNGTDFTQNVEGLAYEEKILREVFRDEQEEPTQPTE